jgi:(2Fe-2S) ferredoxin
MQPIRTLPEAHLFVCANRRPPDDPLGPGCSAFGDRLYDALKAEVARRGLIRSVWVTKTHCLGICPKHGATTALYPSRAMWGGAEADDATTLLDAALAAASSREPRRA